MTRGEVWLVALPFASGHEQSGSRPAVVVQDAAYGQGSPLVLIVPLTSSQNALRFPGTVPLTPTPGNGLTLPSVAMTFQLRALDRTRFTRRMGTLDAADLDAIFTALDALTGRTP